MRNPSGSCRWQIKGQQIRDHRCPQPDRCDAIAEYLEKHQPTMVNAFGIWKEHPIDGLAYQEQARSEW